jgi:uncharacterized delta-60 repeat protein
MVRSVPQEALMIRIRAIAPAVLVCLTLAGCGSTDRGTGPSTRSADVSAANASGSLDPTFGVSGRVQTNVNPNQVSNVALQSDGKIVVVAALSDFNVASSVFGVLRYSPNGTLDAGFGNGGVARTAFTTGFHYPRAVAIQPDGKLIVVGSASNPNTSTDAIAVARYSANGALDAAFGNGGKVTTALLGFRDVANVVVVQSDGKILIGGSALTCFGRGCLTYTALVRYNIDGSVDGSFGSGGHVVAPSIGAVDVVALAGDGSILALNRNGIGTKSVARFSASGAPLPIAVIGALAPISTWVNATFQPDGKIVLGAGAKGLCRFGLQTQVTRWGLDDRPDATFNNPPFFYGNPTCGGQDVTQAIAVGSNGKIVVGGISPVTNIQKAFGVARVNVDGSLDATFGNGGRETTMFTGRADQVNAVAVQPDGKIIAVGLIMTDPNGNTAVALTRYQ